MYSEMGIGFTTLIVDGRGLRILSLSTTSMLCSHIVLINFTSAFVSSRGTEMGRAVTVFIFNYYLLYNLVPKSPIRPYDIEIYPLPLYASTSA